MSKMKFLLFDMMGASYSDGQRPENPTQLSEHNRRFYQQMEISNTSKNATAATGSTAKDSTVKTKKGETGRKW